MGFCLRYCDGHLGLRLCQSRIKEDLSGHDAVQYNITELVGRRPVINLKMPKYLLCRRQNTSEDEDIGTGRETHMTDAFDWILVFMSAGAGTGVRLATSSFSNSTSRMQYQGCEGDERQVPKDLHIQNGV